MITTINSSELLTNVDLICTYCGQDHNKRSSNGKLLTEEGKDFVFEKQDDEEWCICKECQKECNEKGLY